MMKFTATVTFIILSSALLPDVVQLAPVVADLFCTKKADGYYPNHFCACYFECQNSTTYVRKCREGEIFEDESHRCVLAGESSEANECLNVIPFYGFDSSCDVSCDGQENGDFIPDPLDCASYYVCDWGTPKHMHCPMSTLFNPECGGCDHPINVNCYSCETTSTTMSTSSTTTTTENPETTVETTPSTPTTSTMTPTTTSTKIPTWPDLFELRGFNAFIAIVSAIGIGIFIPCVIIAVVLYILLCTKQVATSTQIKISDDLFNPSTNC